MSGAKYAKTARTGREMLQLKMTDHFMISHMRVIFLMPIL